MKLGYEHINLEALHKLPTMAKVYSGGYKTSGPYRTLGDPPGWPNRVRLQVEPYDSRAACPEHVIPDPIGNTLYITDGIDLATLWLRPAIDSEAVIQWMKFWYGHCMHCYTPIGHEPSANDLIIWPPDRFEFIAKCGSLHDDVRFKDSIRNEIRRTTAARYRAYFDSIKDICIPENHMAVRIIQRYYPEHTPNLAWIGNTTPDLSWMDKELSEV